MEYSFPGEGFAQCIDQFMLGDEYLVAPVVTDGDRRVVKLPKGKWQDETGICYTGGEYTMSAPLSRLLYFRKVK